MPWRGRNIPSSTSTAITTTSRRTRYAQVVREMDGLNLQILVNLSGGTGSELQQKLDVVRTSAAPTRMVQFANLDFSDIDQAGYGARQAARLAADVKAGARGLKIFKNFGMTVKYANGARVKVDDPLFDEVFETCARLDVPVLIHVGEPAAVLRHGGRAQRALARAAGAPGAPSPARAVSVVRDAGRRAEPPVREAPPHAVHRRALRVPRQRPRAAGEAAGRSAERLHRDGRHHRGAGAPAPRLARFLREVPGPDPLRQGHLRGVANIRSSSGRSRPPTNTSTATATTTPSGSSTVLTCRTACPAEALLRQRAEGTAAPQLPAADARDELSIDCRSVLPIYWMSLTDELLRTR